MSRVMPHVIENDSTDDHKDDYDAAAAAVESRVQELPFSWGVVVQISAASTTHVMKDMADGELMYYRIRHKY